jgi:hypothetical protein
MSSTNHPQQEKILKSVIFYDFLNSTGDAPSYKNDNFVKICEFWARKKLLMVKNGGKFVTSITPRTNYTGKKFRKKVIVFSTFDADQNSHI